MSERDERSGGERPRDEEEFTAPVGGMSSPYDDDDEAATGPAESEEEIEAVRERAREEARKAGMREDDDGESRAGVEHGGGESAREQEKPDDEDGGPDERRVEDDEGDDGESSPSAKEESRASVVPLRRRGREGRRANEEGAPEDMDGGGPDEDDEEDERGGEWVSSVARRSRDRERAKAQMRRGRDADFEAGNYGGPDRTNRDDDEDGARGRDEESRREEEIEKEAGDGSSFGSGFKVSGEDAEVFETPAAGDDDEGADEGPDADDFPPGPGDEDMEDGSGEGDGDDDFVDDPPQLRDEDIDGPAAVDPDDYEPAEEEPARASGGWRRVAAFVGVGLCVVVLAAVAATWLTGGGRTVARTPPPMVETEAAPAPVANEPPPSQEGQMAFETFPDDGAGVWPGAGGVGADEAPAPEAAGAGVGADAYGAPAAAVAEGMPSPLDEAQAGGGSPAPGVAEPEAPAVVAGGVAAAEAMEADPFDAPSVMSGEIGEALARQEARLLALLDEMSRTRTAVNGLSARVVEMETAVERNSAMLAPQAGAGAQASATRFEGVRAQGPGRGSLQRCEDGGGAVLAALGQISVGAYQGADGTQWLRVVASGGRWRRSIRAGELLPSNPGSESLARVWIDEAGPYVVIEEPETPACFVDLAE